MQLFGNEGKEEKSTVQVGNFEVKVMKASALQEGVTHPARFWPLSSLFYEGADYISIVQYIHWLSKKPCICRRTSYDYTVPETQNKPTVDVSCVICNDKFAWFKKAKEAGYKASNKVNPPEAIRLHDIGRDLMEKVSASSIVSLVDQNGNLLPPVILRYGKELLDQLQLHAVRILNSGGAHLCDPEKGYMFDIIVGKNDGGFRTYKNSMPSVNTAPVNITGAPWKWQEVCAAIQSEILDIPTPEDVMNFYVANYGGVSGNQTFVHPSFQQTENQGNAGTTQQFVPPKAEENNVSHFVPPKVEENNTGYFVPPKTEEKAQAVPTFVAPKVEEPVKATPTFVAPENNQVVEVKAEPVKPVQVAPQNTSVLPCHGSLPNTLGYDRNDANCKVCQQAEGCYNATAPFDANAAGKGNAAVNVNAGNANGGSPTFNTGDIQSKLNVLSKRITNG